MAVKPNLIEKTLTTYPEQLEFFKGIKIDSTAIKKVNYAAKKVVIIGTNQSIVSQLDHITNQAQSVKVFQIEPYFVLPSSERGIQRVVNHPLISKNRRLFNQRIKSLIALRFLEMQVNNHWLKRQLMPNLAQQVKIFLRSDTFYSALQKANCELITWPIIRIFEHYIQSINGDTHDADIIIYC